MIMRVSEGEAEELFAWRWKANGPRRRRARRIAKGRRGFTGKLLIADVRLLIF
jgi:hypothetical protein